MPASRLTTHRNRKRARTGNANNPSKTSSRIIKGGNYKPYVDGFALLDANPLWSWEADPLTPAEKSIATKLIKTIEALSPDGSKAYRAGIKEARSCIPALTAGKHDAEWLWRSVLAAVIPILSPTTTFPQDLDQDENEWKDCNGNTVATIDWKKGSLVATIYFRNLKFTGRFRSPLCFLESLR